MKKNTNSLEDFIAACMKQADEATTFDLNGFPMEFVINPDESLNYLCRKRAREKGEYEDAQGHFNDYEGTDGLKEEWNEWIKTNKAAAQMCAVSAYPKDRREFAKNEFIVEYFNKLLLLRQFRINGVSLVEAEDLDAMIKVFYTNVGKITAATEKIKADLGLNSLMATPNPTPGGGVITSSPSGSSSANPAPLNGAAKNGNP